MNKIRKRNEIDKQIDRKIDRLIDIKKTDKKQATLDK